MVVLQLSLDYRQRHKRVHHSDPQGAEEKGRGESSDDRGRGRRRGECLLYSVGVAVNNCCARDDFTVVSSESQL